MIKYIAVKSEQKEILVMGVKCGISFASVLSLIAINYSEVGLQTPGHMSTQHHADGIKLLVQTSTMCMKWPFESGLVIKVRLCQVSAKEAKGILWKLSSVKTFHGSPAALRNESALIFISSNYPLKFHDERSYIEGLLRSMLTSWTSAVQGSPPLELSALKWCKTCLASHLW